MPQIPSGVYSETLLQNIGTMSTARTQEVINYYFCQQIEPDKIKVQILDIYGESLPLIETVSLAEFLTRFKYEPNKFQIKQDLTGLAVDKAIAQAELHVKRKEFFSAEFEYTKALKLDEDNIRASFGLGKVYMITGENEKAKEVFKMLSETSAILEAENKHIFNDLGIELRRYKLYEQAVSFYLRALEVAFDDENLHFNIARALIGKKDFNLAKQHLKQALKTNPKLQEAQDLLDKFKSQTK